MPQHSERMMAMPNRDLNINILIVKNIERKVVYNYTIFGERLILTGFIDDPSL